MGLCWCDSFVMSVGFVYWLCNFCYFDYFVNENEECVMFVCLVVICVLVLVVFGVFV